MINGCLQLKHAFLSDMRGFAIEHRGQVGKIVSLSLNGFERIVNAPN
jgi:hypothetical protein